MKQNLVTQQYFDDKINIIIEKLDWLMGKYEAHDGEHTLLMRIHRYFDFNFFDTSHR